MTPADLLKINVNEHTEKKANLTYLSWAWAWAEALKADPTATFEVQTFDRGDGVGVKQAYMDVNGTALVWVTVTMFGKPMMCQLPVMDHRNKPISNPDAFAVNTAIMRCMTKGLALHGLGLYIYAGEDLPEGEEKPEVKEEKPKTPKVMQGQDKDWKIKITLKPEGDDKAWVDTLVTAAGMALDNAQSEADVMEIFKVNRNIFDHLKLIDKPNYDNLMGEFKKMKEKFK